MADRSSKLTSYPQILIYEKDNLREENRVLREQLGERRLRFNDDQRRRLERISV